MRAAYMEPQRANSRSHDINVGGVERWASAVGGAALAAYGLNRKSLDGAVLALVGGTLVYRGATGHCPVYGTLGVNGPETSDTARALSGHRGINVEEAVRIHKPAEELYRFWRNLENLPRFMEHLERVTIVGDGRSHWVARGPARTSVEWDAEIINEIENKLIAWRSLEGSDVASAGSVHFDRASGGRGTQVTVKLRYSPPGGKLGAQFAKLFGEEPSHQIREDLHRLKQLLEAGEVNVFSSPFAS